MKDKIKEVLDLNCSKNKRDNKSCVVIEHDSGFNRLCWACHRNDDLSEELRILFELSHI